ncbi:MAG: fumarylacetoacetate hydrolase family protein [Chloroflexota bacterium]|nr:fumarylacetoacetate hydrolase family protein [Chloroflexota bacterium]
MMLVSYRDRGADADWRAGIAHEGQLLDVSASQWRDHDRREGALSVRELLRREHQNLDDIFAWAGRRFEAKKGLIPLETVEIGPPVPDPDKIICLGVNYRDHAAEAQQALPVAPMFFAKYRNSLTGPTDPIFLPRVSSEIDYEGELAVIIGTRCKEVSEQDALRYVAGYTIMNDVSARDVQMQTSQWMAGKALDSFAPMGPGIVPASAIPDPQSLLLTTTLNGQVVQHDSTANMIFSVAAAISFLSSLMTLEPGDIIATGTPSGVGFKRTPPLFLREGDIVEVEIEGIGQLRNPVKHA